MIIVYQFYACYLINQSISDGDYIEKICFQNTDSAFKCIVCVLNGRNSSFLCFTVQQEVIRLGGRVVHSAVIETTHLVANSVLRTVKFLTALAVVQRVVTDEWIDQSSVANHFLGNW